MSWNQPDDNEGRRAPRPEAGPRKWFASLQRSVRRWPGSPAARRKRRSMLLGALVLVLLAWAASGLVQVPAGSKALVLRLGRPVAVLDSGLALRAPWPIDRIIVVDTTAARDLSVRTRVLSSDRVPADLTVTLRYQVQDVPGFLQNMDDTNAALSGLTERLARKVAAATPLEALLAESGGIPALPAAINQLRTQFAALTLGVNVTDVMISDVQVPAALDGDVTALKTADASARAQREAAAAYARALLAPLAARRARLLQEADSYRADTIATAQGEAARFEEQIAAYRKAPDITRRRMYIETVEAVLTRARKVVVDGKIGDSYYLPLEKVLQEAVKNPSPPAATAPAAEAAPADSAEDAARSRERGER